MAAMVEMSRRVWGRVHPVLIDRTPGTCTKQGEIEVTITWNIRHAIARYRVLRRRYFVPNLS